MSVEIIASSLKRTIKNIIKSYTGSFDPFSELIQNALDAVDERRKKAKNYQPKIWIEINLRDNAICVTDNGIGFSREQFRDFLRPNVSFKGGGTRGDKGVGATYLAYGFNFLQMGTKTRDFSYVGEIQGGREWVEDEKSVKTRPTVVHSQPLHAAFQSIDQGSTFCLKLVGEFIRPRSLDWAGADSCNQWKVMLRIKTPLGGIYLDRSRPNTVCELTVVKKNGEAETQTITDCEYVYPHTVIETCVNLREVVKKQLELASKSKSVTLPDNFKELNGVYAYWNFADSKTEDNLPLSLNKQEKDLLVKHRVSMYGFFTYSTDVWDEYNDNVVKLRKGMRILKGGLQMATNGMPQGELVLIPLGHNVYYQHMSHVVVHFAIADADLGRKGFQPELRELAENLSAAAVRVFQEWKMLLKKPTGAPPKIIQDKELHDWKTDMQQHERSEPLVINRKDVFLPTKEVALTAQPMVEQDVIVLFNQLLAGGVIRGIKLMATSQHKKYDGLWKGYLKKPFNNYLFDPQTNPLGIHEATPVEYESAPYVLEYKFSFDGLLEEIESEDKDPASINLVVCWTIGSNWKKRYRITPLLHFSNSHHRKIHGITHLIQDAATGQHAFMVVALKELIDYINDPDSVQDYQRLTYMGE